MRSIAIQRFSAAATITALAVAMAQVLTFNLDPAIPHIKLAWTLTRVLLQL
ncbi:MAG: hypothetical protein LJE93_05080 [Acidobacteria bacterium]|jgi:hypothetical protein|nr:hypothetical protein [Acidobacteriota bacterium]